MAKVVGVKFKNTAKTYFFAPANERDVYKEGMGVIVDTAKGLEYATVVFGAREEADEKITQPLKQIVRIASEKDKANLKLYQEKIKETMAFASKTVAEMGLDMKLVSGEYSFDGKKLVINFSSEDRVDFRELVKVLASHLHARIELRQIGVRDETKLLGGIAPCGRECCCASCISDFGKVSIKMAKNQGLHLNPTKISGLCGRLMCCLEYENDYYAEAYKKVPKLGGKVGTPEGQGVVISNDMLKFISKVKITKPDGTEVYKDFDVKDLEFKKNTPPAESDDEEK